MKPIIIEGTPRSGTRFFCNFIEKQFRIKIFRLQRVLPKYAERIKAYGNIDENENLSKLVSDLNNEIIVKDRIGKIDGDQLANTKQNRSFSTIIDHILSKKAKEEGFPSWGLKFDNPSGMEICNRLFPESKFIHIIRDGRDVHLSAIKCLSEGFYTPYNNAKFWKKQVEYRRKFGKSLGCERYKEIKYEDLLSKPHRVDDILADFLHLRVSNYCDIDIKKNNFDKWKAHMSRRHIRVYEAIAGDLLTTLGYQQHYSVSTISLPEIVYFQLLEFPLKLKVYLLEILNPKTRQRVIRRFKLKLNERKKLLL